MEDSSVFKIINASLYFPISGFVSIHRVTSNWLANSFMQNPSRYAQYLPTIHPISLCMQALIYCTLLPGRFRSISIPESNQPNIILDTVNCNRIASQRSLPAFFPFILHPLYLKIFLKLRVHQPQANSAVPSSLPSPPSPFSAPPR